MPAGSAHWTGIGEKNTSILYSYTYIYYDIALYHVFTAHGKKTKFYR